MPSQEAGVVDRRWGRGKGDEHETETDERRCWDWHHEKEKYKYMGESYKGSPSCYHRGWYNTHALHPHKHLTTYHQTSPSTGMCMVQWYLYHTHTSCGVWWDWWSVQREETEEILGELIPTSLINDFGNQSNTMWMPICSNSLLPPFLLMAYSFLVRLLAESTAPTKILCQHRHFTYSLPLVRVFPS